MSKDQLILIIIYYACFSAKPRSDSFPLIQKFQSNLICNIRFFLLYLAKNIFGNFTAHLSLFELSRCKTIMCFATETKSEKKTQLILLCFILNLKSFSFNSNHLGIPLTCFIAGHNLTSAVIIQAIWFPARTG